MNKGFLSLYRLKINTGAMPMKPDDTAKINCLQCVYFSVTWDPKFPRSCRLYGFKSSDMPSKTVYKSSGSVCDGFVQKKDAKQNNQ